MHGEVTVPDVDVFDKEKFFLERVLIPITQRFPELRIVFEHITTREAVEFVRGASSNIAATITAHHMLLNRNALFLEGIKPHHYCLPILKREIHREAWLKQSPAVTQIFSRHRQRAPFTVRQGDRLRLRRIYTAHAAIELYAEAFEQAGALDKLEAFASFNGADFYGLPRNKEASVTERKLGRPGKTGICRRRADSVQGREKRSLEIG